MRNSIAPKLKKSVLPQLPPADAFILPDNDALGVFAAALVKGDSFQALSSDELCNMFPGIKCTNFFDCAAVTINSGPQGAERPPPPML
jgi:hypothetical protein